MVPRRMPEFHPEIVEGFMAAGIRMTGLPEFLG